MLLQEWEAGLPYTSQLSLTYPSESAWSTLYMLVLCHIQAVVNNRGRRIALRTKDVGRFTTEETNHTGPWLGQAAKLTPKDECGRFVPVSSRATQGLSRGDAGNLLVYGMEANIKKAVGSVDGCLVSHGCFSL